MQVIAFISGKGGVGKSTLTSNVAVGLARRKNRVLVIDLDPQNAQRIHLGLDPQETAGLVREGVAPESVFESPFDVRFIPFGRAREEELGEFETYLRAHPHWLRDSLLALAGDYDFVLLDTPPGPSVYMQQALRAAHRAMMVVLADAASFATIPRTFKLVEELTQGQEAFAGCHLVINQAPQRSELGHQVRKALFAHYAERLVPVSIVRDTAVQEALAFERPVLHYEPTSAAAQSLQSVADWLIDSAHE